MAAASSQVWTGSRVPHSAREREAWGSSGSGLSRWRSRVRWHRRGTRASQRGLVAPPGWPRYPEMRLRVALPQISKVRPRGSLARERSLRLRMPRHPPHRTAAAPTAGSGTSRPVWQPRFVPVIPGNQSCHGPFPWALSFLAAWPLNLLDSHWEAERAKGHGQAEGFPERSPEWAVMPGGQLPRVCRAAAAGCSHTPR